MRYLPCKLCGDSERLPFYAERLKKMKGYCSYICEAEGERLRRNGVEGQFIKWVPHPNNHAYEYEVDTRMYPTGKVRKIEVTVLGEVVRNDKLKKWICPICETAYKAYSSTQLCCSKKCIDIYRFRQRKF